jgi:hypothetical protein
VEKPVSLDEVRIRFELERLRSKSREFADQRRREQRAEQARTETTDDSGPKAA